MKKESFVNKISIYIGVTLVLLIWLLTAYTVSSFLLLKESEESSVWSTIQIYMKQIDSKFIAMDQCVEGIAGNQDLIGQICYGSPADRYYAAVELQKSMKRDVISNAELDYVLIAESLNKKPDRGVHSGSFLWGERGNCLLYLESHGKGRPGKAAMVLYKDRYSCLYCENIQGKQLECGGIFKGKYFSFRYPGKRISRRSEFSSYGRKWCMRGKSGRRKQHVSGRDFGNRRFLEE